MKQGDSSLLSFLTNTHLIIVRDGVFDIPEIARPCTKSCNVQVQKADTRFLAEENSESVNVLIANGRAIHAGKFEILRCVQDDYQLYINKKSQSCSSG